MKSSVRVGTLRRTLVICSIIQCLVIVGGWLDAAAPEISTETGQSLSERSTPPDRQISLSGWFHIIWGDAPRFLLIDDQGVAIHLEIDETVIKPFGNPRALNQKRVTITGEWLGEPNGTVHVLSIEVAKERQ